MPKNIRLGGLRVNWVDYRSLVGNIVMLTKPILCFPCVVTGCQIASCAKLGKHHIVSSVMFMKSTNLDIYISTFTKLNKYWYKRVVLHHSLVCDNY